jgi:hypothetical protein
MNEIHFHGAIGNANVIVTLDGKHVGTIRPVQGGWEYRPKGKKGKISSRSRRTAWPEKLEGEGEFPRCFPSDELKAEGARNPTS